MKKKGSTGVEIIQTMKMGDESQPDDQARLMCRGMLRDMLGNLSITADHGALFGLTGLFWRYEKLSLATLYFPANPVMLKPGDPPRTDIVIARPIQSRLTIRLHERSWHIQPGDVMFLNACHAMKLELEEGGRLDLAHLPSHALAPSRGVLKSILMQPISSQCLPLQLLCGYAGYLLRQEYQTDHDAQMMIEHFYALLPVVAQSITTHVQPQVSERRIDTIKKIIEERLGDSLLTIADIATIEGVTPRALQKLFQREGTTFSKYLLERRLTSAKSRLVSSADAMRISDIAYEVGFNDLSYFNRTFRRRYGTSPTDIRRLKDHVQNSSI